MLNCVKLWLVILPFTLVKLHAQDLMDPKNQMGIYFLPEFNFDVVKAANSGSGNKYEPSGFSYTTGIMYKHRFKDRFWLRTGLFYSQLVECYTSSNAFFDVDSIRIIVDRVGLPLYAGSYFNPDNSIFKTGVGGGLNLLFNIHATNSIRSKNGDFQTVYSKEELESVGLELNLHWLFMFFPHRKLSIGIEPHFNFNAIPIIKTTHASNYLRIGGMININYLF